MQSLLKDPKVWFNSLSWAGWEERELNHSLSLCMKCLVWRAGNYSLVYALNEAFWEVGGGGSWVRCQKPSLKITASSRPALHPTATRETCGMNQPFSADQQASWHRGSDSLHRDSGRIIYPRSLKNTHICHFIWLLCREPLPLWSGNVSGIFYSVFDDVVVLF